MARAGKLGTKELLASPPIATAEIASEQCPLFGNYNPLGATINLKKQSVEVNNNAIAQAPNESRKSTSLTVSAVVTVSEP